MKKYTWILIVTALTVTLVVAVAVIRTSRSISEILTVPEYKEQINKWKVYKVIDLSDTDHIYRVTWTQEYGSPQVVYCKAVFKNDKDNQYKLVAPWIGGLDIDRSNVGDIKFEKVLMDSVPDGALAGQ